MIASYARSGTAWVQQIVSQLLLPGAEGLDVAAMSPWLDRRVPPKAVTLPAIEAQTHRRFLQTHLPVDALVYAPRAKYIYVGRDGRDVVWSLRDHHVNDLWYGSLNDTPGRVVPPIGWPAASIRQSFLDWMERDDPFWPFWGHVRSWWEIRRLPNLLFLHFAGLEADLPGQVRRIAGFLDIPINESRWPFILEHCSFDSMKAHASGGVRLWDGDAGACVTRARPGAGATP